MVSMTIFKVTQQVNECECDLQSKTEQTLPLALSQNHAVCNLICFEDGGYLIVALIMK